jgi:hypothetical protein
MWKSAALFAAVSCLLYLASQYSPIKAESFSFPTLPVLPPSTFPVFETTRLLPGVLNGPESFAEDSQGRIYTGLDSGWIVRLPNKDPLLWKESDVEFLLRTGKDCKQGDELSCGRPLGMRFDLQGRLLVCDSSFGLLRVTLEPEVSVETLSTEAFLANDVLEHPLTQTIYFTDSSSFFKRTRILHEFLQSKPSGRLLAFHPSNSSVETLVSDLVFPNGIELHPDQSSLILASCSRSQLIRVQLSSGKTSVFADDLPCFPDNLRLSKSRRTLLIGCSNKRTQPFSLFHALASQGKIRDIMAFFIPYDLIPLVQPQFGMFLEIDLDGKIVGSWQDDKALIPLVSEVHEYHGRFLVGSFRNRYLGIIHVPEH